MSSTGQWEVVVRNPKKAKQDKDILANGKLSKSAKKKFMDNAPRVTDLSPHKERETAFFGLTDNQNQPSTNKQMLPETKRLKKQEKKPEPPPPPPKNLKEAMNGLRGDDIQSLVDTMKMRFKNSPNLWLKEVASYLNSSLQFPEGNRLDNPEGSLPKDVQMSIESLVKECNQQILKAFFENCLVSLAEDTSKGILCLGYKIMGQVVAREIPCHCLPNSMKLAELRNNYQSRPHVLLSVLWLLGQVGRYNFRAGLGVWLEFMMSLLGLKHYGTFCMSYITELFARYCDLHVQPPLPLKQFFYIFDFTFQETPVLPTKLHKQLLAVYPKIKAVAFASKAQMSRQYFQSFLSRLHPTTHQVLREELIGCLLTCLSSEPECFKIWLHHFPQHHAQSQQLLSYIKRNWETLSYSLDSNEVEDLLVNIVIKGEKIKAQSKPGSAAAINATSCIKFSQELLPVVRRSFRAPWRFLNCMLLLGIVVLLVQDFQQHNGFKESRINKFLQNTGVLSYWQLISHYISLNSTRFYTWMKEYSPKYVASICEAVEPIYVAAVEMLSYCAKQMVFWVSQVVTYGKDSYPQVIAWMDTQLPGWQASVRSFLELSTSVIKYLAKYMEYTHTIIKDALNQVVSVYSH